MKRCIIFVSDCLVIAGRNGSESEILQQLSQGGQELRETHPQLLHHAVRDIRDVRDIHQQLSQRNQDVRDIRHQQLPQRNQDVRDLHHQQLYQEGREVRDIHPQQHPQEGREVRETPQQLLQEVREVRAREQMPPPLLPPAFLKPPPTFGMDKRAVSDIPPEISRLQKELEDKVGRELPRDQQGIDLSVLASLVGGGQVRLY